MAQAQKFERDKLKALVHYICDKASDPSVLGSIKLNKVLWYADTVYYHITGQSITGETYIKRQFGPVSKHVMGVIEDLQKEGRIVQGKANHFGFIKSEYISILDPDISLFSAEEIRLVDAAFEQICLAHTAKSISDMSHDDIWKMAAIGEVLPYETVFVSQLAEVNEDDVAWAQEELGRAAA